VPRRASFAHPSLADLERQLSFAPPAAVRRRMLAAERLAGELDPALAYPLDFVVFRLTGFRPDAGDSVLVPGELLREDLAALVVRASERLDLAADERPGGAVPVAELARELGVDERSLRRWRGEGLLFHRVRLPDGRRRLAVYREALERFRAREGTRLERAARFSRIDPAARAEILARLRALVDAGLTPNLAAKRVAGEIGRSHEAVRLVASRFFAGRGRRAKTPRERILCGRALARGVPAARVAARLGIREATVRRRADEWRAGRLAGLRLAWIDYPTFGRPDAAGTILAPQAVREGLAPTLPEEATAILAAAADAAPTNARGRERERREAEEEAMLAAYHFLVWRAARTVEGFRERPAGRLERGALDAIETDLRWAARLARRLVERLLPTALARLRLGLGRDPATLGAEELRQALPTLVARIVEAIGSVDVTRERHLVAKVTFATDRLVATRFAGRAGPARAAARHPPGSVPLPGLFRNLVPWEALAPDALGDGRFDATRLADLSEADRALLARRHGLDGGPPATVADLARTLRQPLGRLAGRLVELERGVRQARAMS